MNRELVEKTEAFLKETFDASPYLQAHPADKAYRLQHTYRVANIAKGIAEKEGFDVTAAVISGLLHDVAYCEEMATREDWQNHGRRSAAIARPFLESIGLDRDRVNEICYGVAIHVDDRADFPWERTAFCETVGDADNIDRFDAYRIYESLQYQKFSEVSLEEKQEIVASTLARLEKLREMKRIKGYEEEFRPVWHFFDLKSYIIMAVMICGGIWLRASGLAPDVFIAVFYTGLGCALALAGVLFWIMFLLFREKSNDNSKKSVNRI